MSTNFKIGDAVKCIEGYYAPHINGRLGCIVKIDGTDVPYKIELDNGERFWATKVELVTPAKREPKVGDALRLLRVVSIEDRRPLAGYGRHIGKRFVINRVNDDSINVSIGSEPYVYLYEGDYELLPDYADDPVIQECERAIQTARQQIAYAEGEIAARKDELDELTKPKIKSISTVEREWLRQSGDCGVVLSNLTGFGSLEEAYPTYYHAMHKVRAWVSITGCSEDDGKKFLASGVNPFTLPAFKEQIAAIMAEDKGVRK